MNSKIKLFILYSVTLTSCSWLLGVKKLGDKIYFDYPLIIITQTEEYNGIGDCIIPPKILDTKKNDKYVIIKTSNGTHKIKYWLIDKTIESKRIEETKEDSNYWSYVKYSNVFGPLDSIDFFNLKKQKGVKLEW